MIRVHKADAEQVGGCHSCHERGEILVLDITRDGSSVSAKTRLCSSCASNLLAEIVVADKGAVAPPSKKRKKSRQNDSDAALTITCPLCEAAPASPCVEWKGTSPNPDGLHFSRIAEARRGGPASTFTRVRDMAPRTPIPASPHLPARKGSSKTTGRQGRARIPKPYKARKGA